MNKAALVLLLNKKAQPKILLGIFIGAKADAHNRQQLFYNNRASTFVKRY
jgi:hypothetical protein